jgi:hypothetical protein
MSTQIGTLQTRARKAQPMWPLAIVALLVVTIAVAILTAPDGTRSRDETTDETTSVTGTAANTPSELSGGIAQSLVDAPVTTGVTAARGKQLGMEVTFPQTLTGTLANTPTELTGGIAFSTAGAVISAPAELSGRFLAERAKQLGTEIGGGAPGTTGDEVCDICWKYR